MNLNDRCQLQALLREVEECYKTSMNKAVDEFTSYLDNALSQQTEQ